jgi:protein-disulfide isomerase
MKKRFIIFVRVIFIVSVIVGAGLFSVRQFYLYQSRQAIQLALLDKDAMVAEHGAAPFPVVEFFDYRCPHCSTMSRLVDDAIEGDKDVKLILRPVQLGDPQSIKIAAFILAADRVRPGASVVLHRAVMQLSSLPDYDEVTSIALSQGLDVKKVEEISQAEDIKNQVIANTKLNREIGFYGVPALIIGDRGYMPRQSMPGINELRLMMLDAKTRLHVSK